MPLLLVFCAQPYFTVYKGDLGALEVHLKLDNIELLPGTIS